jgi:hypothetical protein
MESLRENWKLELYIWYDEGWFFYLLVLLIAGKLSSGSTRKMNDFRELQLVGFTTRKHA